MPSKHSSSKHPCTPSSSRAPQWHAHPAALAHLRNHFIAVCQPRGEHKQGWCGIGHAQRAQLMVQYLGPHMPAAAGRGVTT
eukprot:1157972-Pelagomonas_calceolata.AAC.5